MYARCIQIMCEIDEAIDDAEPVKVLLERWGEVRSVVGQSGQWCQWFPTPLQPTAKSQTYLGKRARARKKRTTQITADKNH
jgi:hypothetical protein